MSDMTVGAGGKSERDGLESIRFRGTIWLVVSLVLDAGALSSWLIFDSTPLVVLLLMLSGAAYGQSQYRRGLVDAGKIWRMVSGARVERLTDDGKREQI